MPVGRQPSGWRTTTEREGGAIRSEQVAVSERPVVAQTADGAVELAAAYWSTLRRALGGAAWVVDRPGGPEVRALGVWPVLLRFAPPDVDVGEDRVSSRFAIRGGLLSRGAGGEIVFSQERTGSGWRITCTVRGFRPRLPAPVYWAVQRRIHVSVGRRYLRSLVAPVRNGQ